MPTRLTLSQQRALLRALPASRKNACKRHCQECQMRGEGLKSILKSIGRALGPVVKEIGPTVLKEFVLPMVKKKAKEKFGLGLTPPGGALRLAGQRGRGRPRKTTARRKVGRPRKTRATRGRGLGSVRI